MHIAEPGEECAMGRTIIEFEDEHGVVTRYRRHENGRGNVATSARVDPSTLVEPTAYVESGARVGRSAIVSGGSWIDRDAIVLDHAVIGAGVHVGEGAVIGRGAEIGSFSRIGAGATVGDFARLANDTKVPEGGDVPAGRIPRVLPRARTAA
ncbi:transferase [Labedella phragmitis]|uniref:Transferase n=2 Tax=Labedella phragmitis TaxID=2498849 RepID=A0A3S3ZMV6_9MICO|nr:transferase [Labedella phragmitis]